VPSAKIPTTKRRFQSSYGHHPTRIPFSPSYTQFARSKGDALGLTEPKKGDPIEIATAFIERINAADVAGICELMTEDHIFQDALGDRFLGREKMRHGWTSYFSMVGNYKVLVKEHFMREDSVAMFGTASGSYPAPSAAGATTNTQETSAAPQFWEVPAAWHVVTRGGQVAEWRVYADNLPLRKLMKANVP
jgi:ketosteroid isomerase-like protein